MSWFDFLYVFYIPLILILYGATTKRPWEGLSENEKEFYLLTCGNEFYQVLIHVEEVLKEKNT